MSGVVAVLERAASEPERDVLQSMLAGLEHRGPDGCGLAVDGAAGLGHQQHVTTPEARREEPPERYGGQFHGSNHAGSDRARSERAGSVHAGSERTGARSSHTRVVAADVRLDDRARLRRRLDVDDRRATDHELLARAYDRWGVDCAEHLYGAFALALWDAERERLYCARDHVGIRPLYVADVGERVYVASEPGPILDRPEVHRAPDERRIADFLVGSYAGGATFYEALDAVPPGHWLVATADGTRVESYWSPSDVVSAAGVSPANDAEPTDLVDPANDVGPAAYAGVEDHERAFRETFRRAVADRLRTAGPPGALLSGGLDSSSIASVASDLLEGDGRPPLRTFTAGFDEVTACDEREYVRAVHEAGRFEPHFVAGDEVDPLADLEGHVALRRAPFYPALFVLIWRLYGCAGESDASVVLQGYGGDQTMGSDPRGHFRGLARRGRLRTLLREVRSYADRYPGLEARDVLRRDVFEQLAPGPLRAALHRIRDVDHLAGTMVSIDREFAERSGLVDRLAADARRPAARSQRALRRRALEPGEPTFNLELNDVAGAHFGIEPRYPYFDRRVIEHSLTLPPGATVSDGLDRTIVRDALADVLPAAVRERDDKMEFSPNVVHCTREYASDRIEDTLLEGTPIAARYLDADDLTAAYDRLESEGDVGAARELLLGTTLETWLRSHVDVGDGAAVRSG